MSARFTSVGRFGYFRHVLQNQDIPIGEVLAAHIGQAGKAHGQGGEKWKEQATQELITLLRDDYPTSDVSPRCVERDCIKNICLKKNRFWSSLPIIALAMIALAGLAYLGGYTRFMADDYCSAYYAIRFGLLRSIWYWYINWSGRFTAFAFDWLTLTKTLGPYGAHWVPPIAITTWLIATIAAVYISLKAIAPRFATVSAAIAISASFVLAVIVLSPDIAQSYFWLNGMRSYSLPLVVMSIYALLFVWLVPRLKSDKAIWLTCILAFGLTFANGGFSETMAALQPMMLIFITGLHWLSNDRKTDATFKVLAAATLGALLSTDHRCAGAGQCSSKSTIASISRLDKVDGNFHWSLFFLSSRYSPLSAKNHCPARCDLGQRMGWDRI